MAGAGFKTFASGDVLTASDVQTFIMEQQVMVFADRLREMQQSQAPRKACSPTSKILTRLFITTVLVGRICNGCWWFQDFRKR